MDKLAILGGSKTVPDGVLKTWPDVRQEDRDAVMGVLDRSIFSEDEGGPEVFALEEEFAEYIGTPHALAVNSGTSAIQCALWALGIGQGDRVMTTALSFSGTIHPILNLGAQPVFVDVDGMTFNMNPNHVESILRERRANIDAILVVHLHGLSADMNALGSLARAYDIKLIEDAAQAHGATFLQRRVESGKVSFRERKVGTFGRIGCFSLNQTKNLPAGEGGLIVTHSERLDAQMRMYSKYGEDLSISPRHYESLVPANNFLFQEMPAAFARSQLRRLDEYNERARRNAAILEEILRETPGIDMPYKPSGHDHIYHKCRALLYPDKRVASDIPTTVFRDRILEALRVEGVPSVLWHINPMPLFPVFDGKYKRDDFPVASHILDSSLILFEERYGLFIQDEEIVALCGDAIDKVMTNVGSLFDG